MARWTGVPRQRDTAAAARWIRGDADRRAAGLSLDLVIDVAGSVAGEVGLAQIDPAHGTAEIGWWLAAEWRGRGLARRAVRLLAAWSLEGLGLEAVVARCDPANPASGQVAAAAGFGRARVEGSEAGEAVEVWALRRSRGATLQS